MAQFVLKATPEREARYATIARLSPPKVYTLARVLDRAAFPERELGDDFEPAPLYLAMAFTFWSEGRHLAELQDAVAAL